MIWCINTPNYLTLGCTKLNLVHNRYHLNYLLYTYIKISNQKRYKQASETDIVIKFPSWQNAGLTIRLTIQTIKHSQNTWPIRPSNSMDIFGLAYFYIKIDFLLKNYF